MRRRIKGRRATDVPTYNAKVERNVGRLLALKIVANDGPTSARARVDDEFDVDIAFAVRNCDKCCRRRSMTVPLTDQHCDNRLSGKNPQRK